MKPAKVDDQYVTTALCFLSQAVLLIEDWWFKSYVNFCVGRIMSSSEPWTGSSLIWMIWSPWMCLRVDAQREEVKPVGNLLQDRVSVTDQEVCVSVVFIKCDFCKWDHKYFVLFSSFPFFCPEEYELFAFISHMGTSTMCGHYVCHIKKDQQWVKFFLHLSLSLLICSSCTAISLFLSINVFIATLCFFQVGNL